VQFLNDCGSDISGLLLNVAKTLRLNFEFSTKIFRCASSHQLKFIGEFKSDFTLGSKKFIHDFAIIDTFCTSRFVILGTTLIFFSPSKYYNFHYPYKQGQFTILS
jgi:hypothetical protein